MTLLFCKIHDGLLHFKALLLIRKVTTPRLKVTGMYSYLKNVTFNDPLVSNLLNVANRYIFKCLSVIKVENGGRIPGFLDELGPFMVFY